MSVSEEEFLNLVTKTLTKVSVRGLAHRLDMSLPSVRLWRDGKNFPHPATREVMAIKLQHIINTSNDCIKDTIEKIYRITDEMLDDDKVFASLVSMCYDYIEVPVLAERFGISHSTVERWAFGTTTPHPFLRPTVRKVAIQFLSEKLNEEKVMKTFTDEEVDNATATSILQGEMVHDNHGQLIIYLGMFLWNDGRYRSEPDPDYKDVQ